MANLPEVDYAALISLNVAVRRDWFTPEITNQRIRYLAQFMSLPYNYKRLYIKRDALITSILDLMAKKGVLSNLYSQQKAQQALRRRVRGLNSLQVSTSAGKSSTLPAITTGQSLLSTLGFKPIKAASSPPPVASTSRSILAPCSPGKSKRKTVVISDDEDNVDTASKSKKAKVEQPKEFPRSLTSMEPVRQGDYWCCPRPSCTFSIHKDQRAKSSPFNTKDARKRVENHIKVCPTTKRAQKGAEGNELPRTTPYLVKGYYHCPWGNCKYTSGDGTLKEGDGIACKLPYCATRRHSLTCAHGPGKHIKGVKSNLDHRYNASVHTEMPNLQSCKWEKCDYQNWE
jgi:hypothetical protein